MEKNFMLQGATKLSKSEMKSVKGGKDLIKEVNGWCDFSDGTSVLSGCKSDADCKNVYGEGQCR